MPGMHAMKLETVPTFTANLYVGLKERSSGQILDRDAALRAIQTYCDLVGLCVSVTDTQFVYTKSAEVGLIVGFINYPRFPSDPSLIKAHALALGEILLKTCKQLKVTIVMPEETIMLAIEA
jgi:hypothetical protein